MKNKTKTITRRLIAAVLIIGLTACAAGIGINVIVRATAAEDIIYSFTGKEDIPAETAEELKAFDADCVMILGAGIEDANTPSPMLKDRLDAGIELYHAGVAPKILLTGDNGSVGHNEIHVMLSYAMQAGVPEEDIFCDHAGFSTYDSMYRARDIFGVEKTIVVTQKYHEYRALYTGKKLGLEVAGVSADQEKYGGQIYRDFRECLAIIKDFFKAVAGADPVVGGEYIPISGSGVISHGE